MTLTVLRTSNGILDKDDEEAFNALARRIARGSPKILLHLHGGLVDQDAAEKVAQRLSGTGDKAYNAPADWEQVYVVWRTGAIETLRTNWQDLADNDRLYNALLRRLLEAISGMVTAGVGRSVGPAKALTRTEINSRLKAGVENPFEYFDQVEGSNVSNRSPVVPNDEAEKDLALILGSDTELESAAGDIEARIAAEHPPSVRGGLAGDPSIGAQSLGRLDPSIQDELRRDVDHDASTRGIISGAVFAKVVKHGVAIGGRVLKRYRAGRDHGLHATIVEEIARELYGDLIGSVIWGMMTRDAGDHFKPNALGQRLMRAICANKDARLLVVAHSAGAIFASEMLLWAAEHHEPIEVDLVFLAPAVRTSKFNAALTLSASRIRRFRMFAMSDSLERTDAVLGKVLAFIYPASLLYLVSALFEEKASAGLCDAPILGMQRFLDGENSWLDDSTEGPALRAVRQYLQGGTNRTVFAKTAGGDGLNCDAISHGAFDDEVATLKSVATFFA